MEYRNDWETKVFQSAHLHSAQYSPSRRTLRIRFAGQSQYDYQLPPDGWEKLKASSSPGAFFCKNIKPNIIGKPVNEKEK